MTPCIQAVVNPHHPRAYCCGTPQRCRGTLLIAVGIILLLIPLVMGACRLGNARGFEFMTKKAANICVGVSSTFLLAAPGLISCVACCFVPVMHVVAPGGADLFNDLKKACA
jgi:hypothetical protein